MAPLTKTSKVGFAVAGICIAMIIVWVLVDPISHLVILLDVAKEVNVDFNSKIPVSAKIEKDIDIQVPQRFKANVFINQRLEVPLNETLELPLNMTVNAPIEADVLVDQVLDLKVDVPIDLTLTEKELNIEKLQIPLDSELFVDDTLPIETTIPLDTSVKTVFGIRIPVKANIPVKMIVPIKQKIRVKDEITLGVKQLRAPLKIVVPIRAQVPIKQMIHIVGTVKVPIKQTLPIHVKQVIGTTIQHPIPVSVTLGNRIPISLNATFDSDVKVNGTVPIQLGTLSIKKEGVRVKVQ